MILPNTKKNRMIQQACASLALENMYPDKEFIKELVRVQNGRNCELFGTFILGSDPS